uniref:DUF1738 domain-containing protein n=1 Tax=Heterorhabditis bacteriophora TaxID=37862 RepID=A0A1I7XI31_HETBA
MLNTEIIDKYAFRRAIQKELIEYENNNSKEHKKLVRYSIGTWLVIGPEDIVEAQRVDKRKRDYGTANGIRNAAKWKTCVTGSHKIETIS